MTGHRLLLVVRHFGPAGHTGGFRWWRLVRGLTEQHGWQVDVVTSTGAELARPPAHTSLHVVDDDWWGSRLRRAVEGQLAGEPPAPPAAPTPDARTRELADPSSPWPGDPRPLDAAPALAALRRDVLHTTKLATELVWAARATRAARRLPRPDVVLATQPSEPALLAGHLASHHHDVPLVTDHRHVLAVGRREWRTRPERWLNTALDRHVVAAGALAIDIACTATEHVAPLLPEVPRAFVPSGWDAADRVDDDAGGEVDREWFRVVHAGWLYPFHDPRPLLRGLARLLAARPRAADVLDVELLGGPSDLAGIDLHTLAVAHGIPAESWHRTERVAKPDAMARAARAAVLVAIEFPDGLQAPSKLYDYAVLTGDLLLLGAPDGAMARDAARLGVATASTDEQVGDVLIRAFDRWATGEPFGPNDPDGRLAAERSVADLDTLLGAVVADDPGAVRAAAATAGATRPPVAAALAGTTDESGAAS